MSKTGGGAEQVRATLEHRQPAAIPMDFGGTSVTGIHVSCVAALRRHYGLGDDPVRVIDPGQMLGEIGDDLKRAMGIGVEGIVRRMTRFGFPLGEWKPWRMYDGLEVLVPGGFTVSVNAHGDTLLYPQSDASAPPSARMPKDGYFFDSIIRQEPIEEDRWTPPTTWKSTAPSRRSSCNTWSARRGAHRLPDAPWWPASAARRWATWRWFPEWG